MTFIANHYDSFDSSLGLVFFFFFCFFFSFSLKIFGICSPILSLNASEGEHFLLFSFSQQQFFIDLQQEMTLFSYCLLHFWNLNWAFSDEFWYQWKCLSPLDMIQNWKKECHNWGSVSSWSVLPDANEQCKSYNDGVWLLLVSTRHISASQWLVFWKKWKIIRNNVWTLIDGFMK